MATLYKLLNVEKPEGKTHEVEAQINNFAKDGWEVVGYSAFGWRGAFQAGFSHLILFKREG
jgi:hypothetical protein